MADVKFIVSGNLFPVQGEFFGQGVGFFVPVTGSDGLFGVQGDYAELIIDFSLQGDVTVTVSPAATLTDVNELAGSTTVVTSVAADLGVFASTLVAFDIPFEQDGYTFGVQGDFTDIRLQGSIEVGFVPQASYKENYYLPSDITVNTWPNADLRVSGFKLNGRTTTSLTTAGQLGYIDPPPPPEPELFDGTVTVAVGVQGTMKFSPRLASGTAFSITPQASFRLPSQEDFAGSVTTSFGVNATFGEVATTRLAGGTTVTVTPNSLVSELYTFLGQTTVNVSIAADLAVLVDTWDDGPSNIWDDVQYNIADNTPVFALGSRFFSADQGDRFINFENGSYFTTPVATVLEREGLPLVRGGRLGNSPITPRHIKFIRGIYPVFEGEPGVTVNISVGTQDQLEQAVEWETPFPFEIGVDPLADFIASGRYIAIRYAAAELSDWKLQSYDVDLEILGER